MLGHLSIGVHDIERAGRFYDAAMAPVGWVRLWTDHDGLGYGPPGGNDKLAIFLRAAAHPPGPGFHLCFNCPSAPAVDAFHAAAMANGGTDDGPPGLRPHFGPDYYACFVLDPEGWKLEALHKASWDVSMVQRS
jgi:catechol 2,3-dioxygenase-like lactoylglutathione lyase family enzyme